MTHHTDLPVMRVTAEQGRTAWLLRGTCPLCGRTHTHGGGDGIEPDMYGSRVPHCTPTPPAPVQYTLVPVDEATS